MKMISKLTGLYLLVSWILLFNSCKKDKIIQGDLGESGIAKVNVIDGIVSGGKIKASVSAKKLNWSDIPDNQILGEWSLGQLYIASTDRPTILQVASVTDTTKIWYDQVAKLNPGKMYTLYLSGTPGNIKSSFQEETNFPKYILRDASMRTPATDSVVNVRFVNLSDSEPTVNINIQGQSTNVATGLTYQQFTAFSSYSATNDVYEVVFEVRRSSDNELLSTYSLDVNTYRFKSVAIVIKGIYPGTNLPSTDQYSVWAVVYQ